MSTRIVDHINSLKCVSREFLRNIHMISVQNEGKSVICVTKNDEVFGVGLNQYGQLGCGNTLVHHQPVKIEQLCGKMITQMDYNNHSNLVIVGTGEVYAWGNNSNGQIGNGGTTNQTIPHKLKGDLTGKRVIAIACGTLHSLALTSKGEVVSWGYNGNGQIGNGTTTQQYKPIKIKIPDNKVVCKIACGDFHSAAVTEDGECYCWGNNGYGQIGKGNTSHQTTPYRVKGALANKRVIEIACGPSHTLALTDDHCVYAWGSNQHGQIGNGTTDPVLEPCLIEGELKNKKVISIAAKHGIQISVAQTPESVYSWGMYSMGNITNPTAFNCKTLDEVFILYNKVTYRPFVFELREEYRIESFINTFLRGFDDKESCNLVIMVEDKPIHVHRDLLVLRSNFLKKMLTGDWTESHEKIIKITDYPYEVYYLYLKYLYSNQLNCTAELAVQLLDLANAYLEDDLKTLCEEIIKTSINVENASTLLNYAIKFKAEQLEEYCTKFMMNNLTRVVTSKAFENLDANIAKEFLIKIAKKGLLPS